MKELFTLRQISCIMPVSLNTLYRWIKSGRLQVYRTAEYICDWVTSLDDIDRASRIDERTQGVRAIEQRKANIVAHQLMRGLGYERVDEWEIE